MVDNKKLFMGLLLLLIYGGLVVLKLADSSGLVVLLTYAVKKLFDMHEDSQTLNIPTPKPEVVNVQKTA